MASSSSSLPPSSSSSSNNPMFTREEFKLFHSLDRAIFSRIVLKLGRDAGESMHVMAVLLWLEKGSGPGRNLVYNIQSWPDSWLNVLADEAVRCLECLKSTNGFPFTDLEANNDDVVKIPLIRTLTDNGITSLRFFYDNRRAIIPGILKLVENVCVRAFYDIVEQALGISNSSTATNDQVERNLEILKKFYGSLIKPLLPLNNNSYTGVAQFGDWKQVADGADSSSSSSSGDHSSDFLRAVFVPNEVGTRREVSLDDEMDELLKQIHIIRINSMEENTNNSSEEKVAADDRTIFLTFSKGYPISEDEVLDFFTRTFGSNLIEGVEMQEVGVGEQPLYARLVLHSASALTTILNGMPKAKFSINGKHLWARKFVRKYNKSPTKITHQN